MRTNLRPSARAIERPSEVLPTPGGPTKQMIGPRSTRPRSRVSFKHAEVLEDAIFDVLEAVVILVEDARAPRDRSSLSSVAVTHGTSTSHSR